MTCRAAGLGVFRSQSGLLISETQYMQKQLEYLQTVFNYNFTKAYVAFLTK